MSAAPLEAATTQSNQPVPHSASSPLIASSANDAKPPGLILDYQPPPVACLPPPLGDYVAKCAEAIGCDPSLVAMPALAACAAAIGDSRAIEAKPGWIEFPILWTLVVAPSGAQKTPAMKAAMEGLEVLQRDAFNSHNAAEGAYKAAIVDWAKAGRHGPEPTPPLLTSYYIGDATIEAVCVCLRDNPRGLLQKRDELAGWLGGFDKYSPGNEAAQWLEFHSANALRIDRKGGESRTIYIPRALVSVTGTIQEKILRKLLAADDDKHFDNGLAQRFLPAMPPERNREWREEYVPPELTEKYRALFHDLFALAPEINPETGRREPRLIKFSAPAKELFKKFFNANGREIGEFKSDKLKSAWSKLEAQGARLALVFHCIRHAYFPSPTNEAEEISLENLKMALTWIDWLKNEVRRIYFILGNRNEARVADRLLAVNDN